MAPLLSTHSPTAPRGEGGGASHQRGNAFPTPAGRLYGFRRQRRYKKWRRRRRISPAQRYYIPPEGGALNPSGRRQPVPDRTLGAQGQRPGGAINPHARKGVSTFGNTGKHRTAQVPAPTAPKSAVNNIKRAAWSCSFFYAGDFNYPGGPVSESFLWRSSAERPWG